MRSERRRGMRRVLMLQVRSSSRNEALRHAMLESVAEKLARGLPVEILTPSRFVERWLEEFLATKLGILHNVHFKRTEPAIFERLHRSHPAVARSTLEARISALFCRYQTLEVLAEADLLPVRYLRALQTREQRMRFCMALGRALHFHFLEGWSRSLEPQHPLRWQHELASALEKDAGIFSDLRDALAAPIVANEDRLGNSIEHVVVFAPSPMPLALLEYLTTFNFAAAGAELYLWTPCEGPWERERIEQTAVSRSSALLSRWAVSGHAFVQAAWSQSKMETLEPFDAPVDNALMQLQRSVAENVGGDACPKPPDTSLSLLVFDSAEEEVDAVLHDIRKHASQGDLKVQSRDFLIVIAESARTEYLPLLHSAFEQHGLPWVGIGLGTQTSSSWLDAAIKIFSFPVASAVTRQNILAIIMHESIRSHDKGGAEFARETIGSGVLFGVEQSELENTYLEDAHTTWDAGLTHMFGVGDLDVDRLPMDRDVRTAAMTARLLLSMREELRREKKSVREWCQCTRDWTTLFLGPEVARNLSSSWLSLLPYDTALSLCYDEFFPLWQNSLERMSGLSRGTDPRGVPIAVLQPGLNHEVRWMYCIGFSENATRKTNMRALDPTGAIGRASEERDRYNLLTLLMATRSGFWMSSVARNEDGVAVLPARYLEDICRAAGADHLQRVVPTRVRPMENTADLGRRGGDPRRGATPMDDSGTLRQLSWSDVLAFLQCPLQGSVRYHTEQRAVANLEEHEVLEAIALSSHQRRLWLTDAVAELLRGRDDSQLATRNTLLATAARYAERNIFPRGALMHEAVLEVETSMATWLRCLRRIDERLGRMSHRQPPAFVLGTSAMPNLLIPMSHESAAAIQIHGRVACLDGQACRELISIASDRRQGHQKPARQRQEQDLWARRETWLAAATHLALTAAHGESQTRVLTLLHLDGSVSRTQLRAVDVGAAQSWLQRVATDLLFAAPTYVAPIEAIVLYAKQLASLQPFDGQRALHDYLRFHTTIARSWSWGSSRWGPVEDFALFPAPSGTALEELLLLRYAPLYGVQGESVPIAPESRERSAKERDL